MGDLSGAEGRSLAGYLEEAAWEQNPGKRCVEMGGRCVCTGRNGGPGGRQSPCEAGLAQTSPVSRIMGTPAAQLQRPWGLHAG